MWKNFETSFAVKIAKNAKEAFLFSILRIFL